MTSVLENNFKVSGNFGQHEFVENNIFLGNLLGRMVTQIKDKFGFNGLYKQGGVGPGSKDHFDMIFTMGMIFIGTISATIAVALATFRWKPTLITFAVGLGCFVIAGFYYDYKKNHRYY